MSDYTTQIMNVMNNHSSTNPSERRLRECAEDMVRTGSIYGISEEGVLQLTTSLTNSSIYGHMVCTMRDAVKGLFPYVSRAGGVNKVCEIIDTIRSTPKTYGRGVEAHTRFVIKMIEFGVSSERLTEAYSHAECLMSTARIVRAATNIERKMQQTPSYQRTDIESIVSAIYSATGADGRAEHIHNVAERLRQQANLQSVSASDLTNLISTLYGLSNHQRYSCWSVESAVNHILPYVRRLGVTKVCEIATDLRGMSRYQEEITSVAKATTRFIDETLSRGKQLDARLELARAYHERSPFIHTMRELLGKLDNVENKGLEPIIEREQLDHARIIAERSASMAPARHCRHSSDDSGGWFGDDIGPSHQEETAPQSLLLVSSSRPEDSVKVYGDYDTEWYTWHNDGEVRYHDSSGVSSHVGDADSESGAADMASDFSGNLHS